MSTHLTPATWRQSGTTLANPRAYERRPCGCMASRKNPGCLEADARCAAITRAEIEHGYGSKQWDDALRELNRHLNGDDL